MKEENSRKEKKEKVEWDKLRIALFVVLSFILLFAGYEIKSITLDKGLSTNTNAPTVVSSNVKGLQSINSSSLNVKNTIQQSINGLKKEAGSINVEELATSSPSVRKVIDDLKALQNYPASGLKGVCLKICNGI